MSDKFIATYLIKGVKTSTRGDVTVNHKNTSIYSMYPHRTRYNFDALNAILEKYKQQIKPDNYADNIINYTKCIAELDDTPIGIFMNYDKVLQYTNHYQTNSKDITYIKGIYDKNQKIFDELYTSTVQAKVKAAKPQAAEVREILREAPAIAPAVTTTTNPEPVQVVTTTEPVVNKYKENSADFDPTKWQKHVTEFEATKTSLETEIKTLEEALASKFDIVTSNRLKKRQRMLAAHPATLAILKANAVAKQNYYTDGLQANYTADQASIHVDLGYDYFTTLGHTRLTEKFNNANRIAHLARNPALFLTVETLVKECRKKVNRLRVNKAEKETWVQALETAFETLKSEVVKSKYYVNIPADN